MFLCRRWRTSWWRCAGSSIFTSPSRLSKCPRPHLHPVTLAGAVCVSRSRRRNSWWKCRRSFPTLRCMGWWSRTLTFQFLMVVVVSVVDVFSVYTQDRVQQRLVEQSIFQQRLPSKSSTFQFCVVAKIFLLQRRLLVCLVRQIKGFLALSPRGKKVRSWVRTRVRARQCQLIHAGGSAGQVLHGCSWRCVDAVPWWWVDPSGLGTKSLVAWVMAGTGPSSCASPRMLLIAFPVLCARAVPTWNLVHYFRVLVSDSHCSGRLGVAHDCENWIFREMTFFVVAILGSTRDTCSASVLRWLWMNFTHFLRGGGLGS